MTKAIELAKAHGIMYYLTPKNTIEMHCTDRQIEAFAEAIRAEEREACAKVCEELRDEWARMKVGAYDGRYDMMEEATTVCEDKIRERSNA